MGDTVERTPRLSSAPIHRAIVGGSTDGGFRLPVECDGDVIGSALALILDGGDRLFVEHGSRRYLISLVRTPLHFGGSATLLACPECEAPRRHLFLLPQRIACRRCSGLAYDAQHRHRVESFELNARPRRALGKIRAALARVRSPRQRSKLIARAEEMLKLLDEGAERHAETLRKLEARAARLAKARPSLGGDSPPSMGKLPP